MIGDLIAEINKSVQNGNKNNTKRLFCRKKNPPSQIDFIDKKHCQKLVVEVFGNTNKSNKNTNFVTKVALNTYKTGG